MLQISSKISNRLPGNPVSMEYSLIIYTLTLLAFAPQIAGITFNPVSMTDPNKAKEYGIGTAALVCCIVSLLSSILCMYWFCCMEKRFRHRLIMILIYGDIMRGTWLLVFAIISLARGKVSTSSTFCQVSGFLVQYGTQTSDYGVLVMALHSAIQVFYPSTLVSSDGLYPCRRYVYVGAFVLPVLMAGLAFINPAYAYVSLGSYCTLPIRPFWYRLAFTWVPRYIIIVMIIGLAVAIYAHVGFQFRAYSNTDQSFHSFRTSDGSNTSRDGTREEPKMEDITFELTNMDSHQRPQPQRRQSSVGHGIFSLQYQASSAPVLSPSNPHKLHRVSFDSDIIEHSLPANSLHPIRPHAEATRPVLIAIPSGRSVTAPASPMDMNPYPPRMQNSPKPTDPSSSSKSTRTASPSSPSQVRLARQRQRIHRQLRLMFIYPLVYTLMWTLPFVMHSMNYWDKWALNPVEFLRVGSSISITLMGFADALIFSLREKPWRGIEGSDGSFLGSFVYWTKTKDNVDDDGADVDSEGTGRKWGSTSYRTSASGEFGRVAAGQARARLDLEREERLQAMDTAQGGTRKEKSPSKKTDDHSGLNVGEGENGQVYDDTGLEDDTA